MTDEGMCYFYNHQKLYSWDLYTGKWNLLLDGSKEDLAKNEGYCYLAIDGAENLMLFDCEEEPGIYILSEQEPSTENYARIVSLTTSCSDLSSAAADFTRKNPAQGLLVEPPERDQQAYRARVMADMTAGKVPDALYVSGEDMEILYEKGLLMDMTGLLPEQVTEQLFPGILECGRIDGKQTGFPLKATIDTMFVNRKVWQEDGWSLADVMELAYGSGELEAVIATAKPPYAARGALENLALQDLGHSPFVDLEAGTCSFDSEQFIENFGVVQWLWENCDPAGGCRRHGGRGQSHRVHWQHGRNNRLWRYHAECGGGLLCGGLSHRRGERLLLGLRLLSCGQQGHG